MYQPIGNNNTYNTSMVRNNIKTNNKKRRKIALWKKLFLLMFLLFVALVGNQIYNQQQTIEQRKAEVSQLEEELAAIEKENKRLERKESRLHDEDYIAEIARQNYYLSKPGEVLFIVPQAR